MLVATNPYATFTEHLDPPLVAADIAVGHEGWTIHYELTPEDLTGFSLYVLSSSRATKKNVRPLHVMSMIAVLVPLLWIVVLFKLAPLKGVAALGLGWAIFVSLAACLFGVASLCLKTVEKQKHDVYRHTDNRFMVGSQRLSLLPAGLRLATDVSDCMTRWEGIIRIACQSEALYLLTSDISAIIVPRRALSDDVLFQQFARAATELHAQAGAISIAR